MLQNLLFLLFLVFAILDNMCFLHWNFVKVYCLQINKKKSGLICKGSVITIYVSFKLNSIMYFGWVLAFDMVDETY